MKEGFLLKVFRVMTGGFCFALLTLLFWIVDLLWNCGEMFFLVMSLICGMAFIICLYVPGIPLSGKITTGVCTYFFSPFGIYLFLEWLRKKSDKYRNKAHLWMKS